MWPWSGSWVGFGFWFWVDVGWVCMVYVFYFNYLIIGYINLLFYLFKIIKNYGQGQFSYQLTVKSTDVSFLKVWFRGCYKLKI